MKTTLVILDRNELNVLTDEPPFRFRLIIVLEPLLVPRVREIYDQDELNEDENESADHADHHPRRFETGAMLDEHGAHEEQDDAREFEEPKPLETVS